ncbi:transcriptional regulator TrmB [Halovivax cerinus]|uniref:HVO-2833 C-terminal domain-containing protein n=1 Tax=Halovivax cerinus TaxID=1487865 RepID=A0ABD5NSY6_9EURY|nr:transcriptional regulator TrmB [Halovivax cerinus]
MIGEKELRVLSVLDAATSRRELAGELDYQETTITKALGNLEQGNLIYKERNGNQTLARPVDNRCVETLQSLTKAHPHVDFPELFTSSMLNVLYYLSSHESWTATELTERTDHARATIYRNLRTLTNRAMATKTQSHYQLTAGFEDLHVFASEFRHHLHRVRIKRDVGNGTIVWESHDDFLVRTEKTIADIDYHLTGLDAYAEYGLRFHTTSEQYYYYSANRDSLTAEELVCHLLLIENDSRHRKYALLLVAAEELSPEDVESTANEYGIADTVDPLLEFLQTCGETDSNETPQWSEFETLAAEYEVEI